MAYIGRPSIVGNFVKLDAISVVNGQAAYTMQNSSANFTDYSSVNQFMVSLNGTIQSPGSSFTVSGSTITFASNLVTNDVIDFIIVFGNSLSSGVPTDATVSTAKIVDDAVTAAKLNNDIISGSTELASEPADTDEFLVSDAGTLKRIDYSLIKGGGITEADMYRLTSNLSGDHEPIATSNMERVDDATFAKIGTGVSYDTSNGRFTFGATGLYLIQFQWRVNVDSSSDASMVAIIQGSSDDFSNSDNLTYVKCSGTSSDTQNQTTHAIAFFNCTNVSTHKVRLNVNSMNNNDTQGNTNETQTGIYFIRLGDSQ